MADDKSHADDIGELRGQVSGLSKGLEDLGREVRVGLKGLTDYIQQSNEKTDQRFEDQSKAQIAALAMKGNSAWQVLAVAIPSAIGAAGLAFTFWTLAKAPVDDKFLAMASAITANATDLKEVVRDQRDVAKGFVPRKEIDEIEDSLKVVSDRQFGVAVKQAALEAEIKNNKEAISFLREDHRALAVSAVTKDQIASINERLTIQSNRTQALYDKNYAVPAFPCLVESGAGCQHSAPK